MTNSTTIIGYTAIAAILISLFFIGTEITGYATSNATVNVTISQSASINFTTAILDFGAGAVNTGQPGATINSIGNTGEGTWAQQDGELVLVNIGNVDVTTLTIATNKSADDFIGGDTPTFKAKVTNSSGHTTSCVGADFEDWNDITMTPQDACDTFTYSGNNSIDINFQLYIPNDAVGARTVGILAVGTA